jgi:hypothetical protein
MKVLCMVYKKRIGRRGVRKRFHTIEDDILYSVAQNVWVGKEILTINNKTFPLEAVLSLPFALLIYTN